MINEQDKRSMHKLEVTFPGAITIELSSRKVAAPRPIQAQETISLPEGQFGPAFRQLQRRVIARSLSACGNLVYQSELRSSPKALRSNRI